MDGLSRPYKKVSRNEGIRNQFAGSRHMGIVAKKSPLRDEPQRGLVFVSSPHPLPLREGAGVRGLLR